MGELATGNVRALIARSRVAELQAQGWRIVGPGEEGSLMMEGPQAGGSPQRLGRLVDDLFDDLVAAAIARAEIADRSRTERRRAA